MSTSLFRIPVTLEAAQKQPIRGREVDVYEASADLRRTYSKFECSIIQMQIAILTRDVQDQSVLGRLHGW